MNRIVFLLLIVGVSLASVLCWAAEPPPKDSDNDAVQLKTAQNDRIEVLTQLVKELTAQYRVGTVDFAQVSSAEIELCDAMLDSTDEPAKRVALLTKQLDKANDAAKIAQARHDAGTVTHSDVLRAKSLCLDIKIRLLRERSRKEQIY